MVLEIHPMTEADLPAFQRIQTAGFRNTFAQAIFPASSSEEEFQKSVDKMAKTMREDPAVHFLKVVDTELGGKTIACAKWRINLEEMSEEAFKVLLAEVVDDCPPARREFFEWLNEMREKWMGTKPFYFLHILVTHPDHHRRGAGGMLVKWGLDQADKAGLPAYLEGSAEGRPLYERLGFEAVEEKVFDLSKHGLEGGEVNAAMIRQPRPVGA